MLGSYKIKIFVLIILILFFIYVFFFSINNNILVETDQRIFDSLENMWNEDGFWGKAKQNMDNRCNEAIVFYNYYGKKYGKNFGDKLEKSIIFSLYNLRGPGGGFLQENRESYMRTAMYIIGVSEVLREHDLNEEDVILRELDSSIDYLINNMPHSQNISNQDIAVMVAFYELYLTTQKEEFLMLWEQMRDYLISVFIFEGDETGYWPEAPSSWSTRIHVPYLQTQIMLLGFYLNELNIEDKEMLTLFNFLVNKYTSFLNLDNLSLNVKESLGLYSVNTVPIEVPSVFWFSCNLSDRFCDIKKERKKEVIEKTYFELLNHKDSDILMCTDSFYRFGIITILD